MTGAFSTASFGSCAQVHHGAIYQTATVPIRLATIGFVRWRQAGVWDRIMEALAGVHDAAVQMIDTSVVRAPGRVLHRGQQGRAVSIKLSIVGVATRYDKLAANYLAFVKLACIRLWLRVYKFTTW